MLRAVLILLLTASCSSYYHGPKSDHFDGKKFLSEDKTKFRENLRFAFSRKDSWRGKKDKINFVNPSKLLPIKHARVIFVGHSTFLIQTKNTNILTDPIWSDRAGPITLPPFSPKRQNPPAIKFVDLPKIDFVLLSHSSYYHTDIPTIKNLQKRFAPKFVTGLGNCYYLNKVKKLGLDCFELDWDQSLKITNNIEFIFLPTRNWSKRTWFDTNKSLWGSFLIRTPKAQIYFAGDTAYSNHFYKIYKKYGRPDLALLPIGSYEPNWYFGDHHMSPEDAVLAHRQLDSKKSVGMHFNTFQTSGEGYEDPATDLEIAKLSYGLKKHEFVAPRFGEVFEF
ncbi:MAG: hypothetical protein FJX34_01235 [Alphaproteobacteria bacterium]|nr:hypothetical protein [Alphaproteobacteria bacterium]